MKSNLILAIETSSNLCSIAIAKEDAILLEYTLATPNSHDQFLAELTKRAFIDLQIDFPDIAAVAISSGPGSFTGLRIGAAFAKGICFDDGIKLVPVPTLSSLAYACKEFASVLGKRIIAIMHSHKDIYFIQEFTIDGNPVSEVSAAELGELRNIIYETDLVVGPGAEQINKGISFESLNYPSASKIAKLGWKLFCDGNHVPSQDFVPSYFMNFTPKFKSKSE
jgi:tRNA threonylcarbamoyladenosine biosynthesis protein TsaB